MNHEEYDVIVLGGGPAGEVAAARCRAGMLATCLVERDLIGGASSYDTCIPSKVLLHAGHVAGGARNGTSGSAATGGAADALSRRDRATNHRDDKHHVRWLEEHGVDVVRGHGRLVGPRLVKVDNGDGGARLLHARRAVVLATGSQPDGPAGLVRRIDGRAIWDARHATSATSPPDRLTVIGGGPTGVELAQAWRRLGTRVVTVVEQANRLLPLEEPFASQCLRDALDEEGIAVITGIRAVRLARPRGKGPVTVTLDDGRRVVADDVLVATGRRPATTDCGLENVGLEPGRRIDVDEQLRATAVPGGWLYVVGDANGRAPLTHMAKYQARLAAEHILGWPVEAWADHRAVPRIVFTDPQVAATGLTVRRARESGIDAVSVSVDAGAIVGAALHGDVASRARLVIDPGREIVVGATFVGPGVAELLHSATVAIVGEVPLRGLRHAVPAFPTYGELWFRLLDRYFARVFDPDDAEPAAHPHPARAARRRTARHPRSGRVRTSP